MEIREYRKATRCERRSRLGRLRRCRQPLIGQCQYCGAGFCEQHGQILADGQEVCRADRCEAKRMDLERHLEFKVSARLRNAELLCALTICESEPADDCERCRTRACAIHMRQVIMTVSRGSEQSTEAVKMCVHCAERLVLWVDE